MEQYSLAEPRLYESSCETVGIAESTSYYATVLFQESHFFFP